MDQGDLDYSGLKRDVYPIPPDVLQALESEGVWGEYAARPAYQRNDYIGWITRAKREATRTKRMEQMINELRSGDAYMGMPYPSRSAFA